MRVGDVFEWVAAALFVAAGYLSLYQHEHPLALAFLIAGICLVYFGQCHANTELPRPRLPKLRAIHPVAYIKRKRKVEKNVTPPRPR